MHCGQELVLVPKVILAELAGDIAERLEELGDGRVLGTQTLIGAGQPDLGQPRADRRLPGDERGPPGGAALLAVPVGEYRAFSGHAVDVGRAVPHDAEIVGADVVPPDVVAPENQNVGLLRRHQSLPPRKSSVALDLHGNPTVDGSFSTSAHAITTSMDQYGYSGMGPPSWHRA